jgi:fatty-acyl-CoA synthase
VRDGVTLDQGAPRGFLEDKVARWWLPDDVVVIDTMPKTSVGKFDQRILRERYRDRLMS